jgi:hypothetical protein
MYSLHQITAWSNIDEEVCPKFPHTALACIENEQAVYISLVHKIMELIILGYIVYLICTSTSTKLGRVLATRTNTSDHTSAKPVYTRPMPVTTESFNCFQTCKQNLKKQQMFV